VFPRSVGWLLSSVVILASCSRGAPPPAPVADAGKTAALPAGEGVFPVLLAGDDGHGTAIVAWRLWRHGPAADLLVVEPLTLRTRLLPLGSVALQPVTEEELGARFGASPWLKARFAVKQHASALQDAGLSHLLPTEKGIVLTVDLCPSRKQLDRAFVQGVLDAFAPEEKPVPVAFALTGVWLAEHRSDVAWLASLEARHELDITWIDHSFHHRYDPARPLATNFLLEPGTDLDAEVLLTEKAMLEAGLVPSVFFRFPGLVSNVSAVARVVDLGLVPVGSDAWLAKKQRAQAGSIVLVHGNGNEPQGLEAFLALVKDERKAIQQKQFLLLDLREATEEDVASEK
jgi:hypothetical protein